MISKNFVLTAAHCRDVKYLNLTLVPLSQFTIRMGELDLEIHNDKERDYKVKSYIIHPGFRIKSHSHIVNDIALIKLTQNVM